MASSINWEWVHAVMHDMIGVPIPRGHASTFTNEACYTDVEWLSKVDDTGNTVLQALGVDDKDMQNGSFWAVVAKHKKAQKMVSTRKVAPRGTFLTSEFYGAWPPPILILRPVTVGASGKRCNRGNGPFNSPVVDRSTEPAFFCFGQPATHMVVTGKTALKRPAL